MPDQVGPGRALVQVLGMSDIAKQAVNWEA